MGKYRYIQCTFHWCKVSESDFFSQSGFCKQCDPKSSFNCLSEY